MSVPNATVLPATVAFNVTFALPSMLTLPDKSPPRVIVLAVVHLPALVAVSALPVNAPTKLVDVTLV